MYVDKNLLEVKKSFNELQSEVNTKFVSFEQMGEEIQKVCETLQDTFLKRSKYDDYTQDIDRKLAAMRSQEQKAIAGVNDLNAFVETLQQRIYKKVDIKAMDALVECQAKFVVYEDLKDLYNKVMPPLEEFDREIQEISNKQEQQREVIQRYDVVMTDKASKFSVTDLELQCRKKYAEIVDLEEHQSSSNQKMTSMKQAVDEINSTLRVLQEHI